MTRAKKIHFWSRKIFLNLFSKRFAVYALRWQLSTPILALCIVGFASLGSFWATVIANAIGAVMFWWFDRYLFKKKKIGS